jgi:hypothetical protein
MLKGRASPSRKSRRAYQDSWQSRVRPLLAQILGGSLRTLASSCSASSNRSRRSASVIASPSTRSSTARRMFPQPEGERKGATRRFLVTTSSEPARRGRGKVPAPIAQKAQPAAWLGTRGGCGVKALLKNKEARMELKLQFRVAREKNREGSHGSDNALPQMRKTTGPGCHPVRPH